jgi:hypothetical protein
VVLAKKEEEKKEMTKKSADPVYSEQFDNDNDEEVDYIDDIPLSDDQNIDEKQMVEKKTLGVAKQDNLDHQTLEKKYEAEIRTLKESCAMDLMGVQAKAAEEIRLLQGKHQ